MDDGGVDVDVELADDVLHQFEVGHLAVPEAFGHDEEAFVDSDLGGRQAQGVHLMVLKAASEGEFESVNVVQGLVGQRECQRLRYDSGFLDQVEYLGGKFHEHNYIIIKI